MTEEEVTHDKADKRRSKRHQYNVYIYHYTPYFILPIYRSGVMHYKIPSASKSLTPIFIQTSFNILVFLTYALYF